MDEFEADLESGNLKPVYVLTGTEQLLRREAITRLSEIALAGTPKEFNETRLVFKETSPDAIIDACRTFPMLGRRRFVLVQGIEALKAKESDAFAKYFEDPVDTAVLVLVVDTIDLRQKIWKSVQKVGRIVKLDPPYQNKLPAWIEARARRKGMRIQGDAATLLGDVVGTDLAGLDEALERLYLFVSEPGKKPDVTLADVEKCVARTRVHTVFELADALGRRETKTAVRVLESMLAAKEPPIRILAMVARHVRRLWEASELMDRGESPESIGKHLGLNPYFVKDFLKQARLFGNREYAAIIDRVFATDRLLKSSRLEPELHMFDLVLGMCGARGGRM